MQWSFSNEGSAPSQLLSFKASSDVGLGKGARDSLAASGSMTVSQLDAEVCIGSITSASEASELALDLFKLGAFASVVI